jgi:hypothetical protein
MQAEGLQHKVIGPLIETAYARIYLLARCEHQDGQIGIHGAKLVQYLLAIPDGQIQIKDRQVRHFFAKCLYGSSSVIGHANTMPVCLQAPSQKQPQRFIVVGNQYPHLRPLRNSQELRFPIPGPQAQRAPRLFGSNCSTALRLKDR